ncbi:uncharacterized protein LOC124612593 [Schistocerca americana]|uniref:uncharacterized protein LOC124612593 n=1 Tax=Schistocerca americana TaxID=7009 RepID=UPI001F4F114F|nr:uncharacterized protein LOC124612593 [Schistocerca americana]
MSLKSKEAMRFATTGHNKENRHQSQNKQVKSTGINQQRTRNAADKKTAMAGSAVNEKGERTNVAKSADESLTDKNNLKLQVAKWRAERQARLAAKIIRKQGKNEVPPAVLGISAYNVSLDIIGNTSNSNLDSKDNRKPTCQKNVKNTTKRKPVEVRQTTASRLRMEKANPLLTIGKCTGLTSTFKVKTPASSLVRSTNITRKPFTATTAAAPKQLFKVPRCNEKKINNENKYTGPVQQKSSVLTVKKTPSTFTPVNRIKNVNANVSGVSKLPPSTQKNRPQLSAGARQKNVPTTNQRAGLRRSSSATTFHSHVGSMQLKSVRSPSVPDISRVSKIGHSSAYKSAGGPNGQETRTGVADTPHRSSLRKSRMTLFGTSQTKTPLKTVSFTPQPEVLRRNLLNWLEKRGKSLNAFSHLRCFGLHKPASDKPDKEVALSTEDLEGNKEAGTADVGSEVSLAHPDQEIRKIIEDNENVFDNCNLEDLKNILSDLHKLILASYPRDQCEEWLHLIRKKFPNLDDEPLYWECLAALEEARGDYSTAIDFYSRAIVSGAEAEVIDKSLDLLWEKFTSLKLQSEDEEVDKKKQKTPRRSVDPRQVFKSSIIKFALQQKAVKQLSADLGVEPKSLHYVATPVRRSTRKSNNPYKSSSVVCVGSLNTLQPDVRDSVVFVSNTALTPKV